MTKHGWHRYFDDNDVSNWSICGFHETWIRQNKDDPKNLRYQKANDALTKSLRLLINDCEDDVKKQGAAAKLLANKAAIAHARRNQLFADPLNAFLDAWLVTMPICGKRNHGSDIDELWTLIESKNLEKAALTKLNCQQNVTIYSSPLTDAAMTNLSNIIPESTSVLPSKRPFECLDSETASTRQEANKDLDPQPEGAKTPPPRFPPNKEILLSTPDKRDMHSKEIACYLDAMENLLKYNQVVSDVPPVWTKSLESYLRQYEFKIAAMEKINGDEGNYFRLYCEKILTDFYNLVDIFPNISRKIGERKYIVQNISSLFKFYETTFGKISFDWIESHSPAGKLTKSASNSGIIKVDMRGVRLLDDKEVFHMEVSGPPSLSSKQHCTDDTKKSLRTDILNLIAILLEHINLSVEVATRIKVFSFQVIKYRITFYSLNMLNDGSFLSSELFSALFPSPSMLEQSTNKYYFSWCFYDSQNEVIDQISLMQDLDLNTNRYEGKTS
ncbi:12758_t:CDS:10 [Ambispora leptoticha]|uniref:12758_t:CDS:1 n=1 Tax=Ambispora leptoticha TaxID=144679 RepID=A0A9N9FQZ7_9GLOM|nr:12758_t:CDS:10 [Ambispora leptoticha]